MALAVGRLIACYLSQAELPPTSRIDRAWGQCRLTTQADNGSGNARIFISDVLCACIGINCLRVMNSTVIAECVSRALVSCSDHPPQQIGRVGRAVHAAPLVRVGHTGPDSPEEFQEQCRSITTASQRLLTIPAKAMS
jgi:hypothetical protein